MSSRASLLLAREQHWLHKHGVPKGISISLVKNNIFHWHVTIHGLEGTPWEGGIFQVELYFDENFNETPPDVYFITVPFHPNIDIQSGRPCIPFLVDASSWNPSYTIETILLHLQHMLSDPGLENPVNPVAAEIFIRYPRLYSQLVYDSVVASRRLVAGMSLFDQIPADESRRRHKDHGAPGTITISHHHSKHDGHVSAHRSKKSVHISFEHYHQEWKSLATSISKTPVELAFQSASTHRMLAISGFSHRSRLTDEQYQDILQKQHLLWYGNIGHKKVKQRQSTSEKKAEMRKERIESLRRIYNLRTSLDAQQDHKADDPFSSMFQNEHDHLLATSDIGGVTIPVSTAEEPLSRNMDGRSIQLATDESIKPNLDKDSDAPGDERVSVRATSGKSNRSNTTTTSLRSTATSHTNSTRPWTGASSGIARTESRPMTGRDSDWEAEADDLVEWSKDLPA